MNNNQDMYTPETETAPAKKTMGIWSLIMGIASLVFGCCGGGVLLGILGIVFANISKKNNEDAAGMAKTGKILSIVGIVVSIIAAIVIGVIYGGAIFASMGY